MPKNVGIMTLYYKTYNYGAQLQCYALQKVLSKLGYSAELIRFKWNKAPLDGFYRYACSASYAKFDAFSKSIPHSKHVYTPENINKCANEYDIFVCGSDQIWGVEDSMPIYVLPQITLSFVPENRTKIAYAASMGGSMASSRMESALNYPISRLDAVSIRETSAIDFISKMTAKPVSAVLDPTMLLTSEEWDNIAVCPKSDADYIFVYNIGNNTFLDERARKIALEQNCEVKTVSYSPVDTAGPAEFIGLIKNAKCVLTNSFHGTVFSILYKKPFLTFPVDDRYDDSSKNVRITDLLKSVGLSKQYVATNESEMNDIETDYNETVQMVNRLRETSVRFLAQALSENGHSFNRYKYPQFELANREISLQDYLYAISSEYSSKELLYETQLARQELAYERLARDFGNEIIRNEIYCKLMKFQKLGLSLDYDPLLKAKVVIYGAGKIGRLASECFNSNMLCFADRSDSIESYFGYKVFTLNDSELIKLLQKQEQITFLITPVWDFDILETEILDLFPAVNIVSIERCVEKICL